MISTFDLDCRARWLQEMAALRRADVKAAARAARLRVVMAASAPAMHLVLVVKPLRCERVIRASVLDQVSEWADAAPFRMAVPVSASLVWLYDALAPRPPTAELVAARAEYVAIRAAQAAPTDQPLNQE